jgi:hypothetical protein
MSERNEIQREFDAFGQALGMSKHSGSWYRTRDDVTTVLNLQKSDYGPSYYINIAFWLRALGESRFPKDRECHLRIRLEHLVSDRRAELAELLDLKSEIPDGERGRRLRELLMTRLKPILDGISSVDDLREMRRRGLLTNAAIRGPALRLLEAS